jgi:PPOX class probable F420-dependent enzyme
VSRRGRRGGREEGVELLDERTIELATGKNFAVFTTLRPDGHPASQVMWVDADADHLLINTEVHRRKFRNVLADPRVTVTIWQADNPYEYREIRGVVDEIVRGEPARDHIDRLALRYFGRLYDPDEIESERVILRIRPL